MRHSMRGPSHVPLQVASRLLKTNPGGGACRTGPLAWLRAPGPQNLEVDEDVRWDPPHVSSAQRRGMWAEPAVVYCSRRPSPSPMWGSRFVGARAVGPWVGEQKPLGKTHQLGNPSPESTYLPTSRSR